MHCSRSTWRCSSSVNSTRGMTRADIARRLGKSAMYITYVCALMDPPDWLMDVYRAGKCRGLRELHELRRLFEMRPLKSRLRCIGRLRVTRHLAAFQASVEENAKRDEAGRERASSKPRGGSSGGGRDVIAFEIHKHGRANSCCLASGRWNIRVCGGSGRDRKRTRREDLCLCRARR